MQSAPLDQVLISLLIMAILGGIFAFVVVRAIMLRFAFSKYAWQGLFVSGLCLLLALPSEILKLCHLDARGILPPGNAELSAILQGPVFTVGVILGVGFLFLLQCAWNLVAYVVAAAEWDRAGRQAFPLLARARPDARPYVLMACFGVFVGLASCVTFHAYGVDVGESVKQMQRLFPGMDNVAYAIQIPVWMLAFIAPAVLEEVVYRGVLLGFLLRVLRRPLVPVVLTAFLWALLHLGNTDAPGLKCLQIFVTGLVLGAAARRYSVEAAIAGHVGLNLTAVLAGYWIEWRLT